MSVENSFRRSVIVVPPSAQYKYISWCRHYMLGYHCGVAVFKFGGLQEDRTNPFVVPFPHSALRCTKHIHTRLRVRPTFL